MQKKSNEIFVKTSHQVDNLMKFVSFISGFDFANLRALAICGIIGFTFDDGSGDVASHAKNMDRCWAHLVTDFEVKGHRFWICFNRWAWCSVFKRRVLMYSPTSSSLWRGSDGKRLSWNILCSSGILLATSGVFAAYMMTGRNWSSDNLLAGKCRIQPCTREFWSKCARLGGRDSSTTPRITFGPFTHHGYQCCEPLCSNSVMPVSNMVMATRSNWVLQTFARFFEKFDLFVDILALYPDSTHHVEHNILHNVWGLGALLRDWNEVLRLCIKKELWNLFNALVSPSPSWDWALVKTPLQVFNVFHCFFIWSTFKIAFI